MQQEELNEEPSEILMAELCVKENDDYEVTLYKKGGTFGGIEKRPGLIEETTIY